MALSKETKEELIREYGKSGEDTGSCEAQIALLTERITELTQGHFRSHPKDKHSLYGLRKMVELRKKLLKYMKRRFTDRYENVVRRLGLRR